MSSDAPASSLHAHRCGAFVWRDTNLSCGVAACTYPEHLPPPRARAGRQASAPVSCAGAVPVRRIDAAATVVCWSWAAGVTGFCRLLSVGAGSDPGGVGRPAARGRLVAAVGGRRGAGMRPMGVPCVGLLRGLRTRRYRFPMMGDSMAFVGAGYCGVHGFGGGEASSARRATLSGAVLEVHRALYHVAATHRRCFIMASTGDPSRHEVGQANPLLRTERLEETNAKIAEQEITLAQLEQDIHVTRMQWEAASADDKPVVGSSLTVLNMKAADILGTLSTLRKMANALREAGDGGDVSGPFLVRVSSSAPLMVYVLVLMRVSFLGHRGSLLTNVWRI